MPHLDPDLMRVVIDLERGLRELGMRFAVVGALVPELLLDVRPHRMTNDVDMAVVVGDLTDFDLLKRRLGDYGFTSTGRPYRLQHYGGGWVDILPVNDTIVREGWELEEGLVLNMAGFNHVVPHAVSVLIERGPTLPLAPLPLYVLLKLVAFSDRREPKDLAGILHCLEHYLGDDDRRYGVGHAGAGVPYEFTGAYVVGIDARPYLDEPLSNAVQAVLDRFDSPDATAVDIAARETGRFLADDEERLEIFQLFRWYRLGIGL